MNKFRQFIASFLPLLLFLTGLSGNASAALQAVGPIDPVTTIPSWYQDTKNLALMPCLDQNGFCLLPPPFDPAIPPVSTIATTGPINDANFPGEGFYYSADAIMPIEAGELARLTFVLEFAFLGGVIPDAGTTFLRTDLQKMQNLTPNSTYRVTHPYGSFEFTTDGAGNTTGGGGVAVRLEDGFGVAANYMPPLMQAAATTNIGPFLTPASGILPTAVVGGVTHTYIGDAITPVQVTGSPTGNNFYRIDRLTPAGGVAATWQTNLFTLAGRVFTGQIPSPMTIDRVTYARDAASEQIDIFATALPTATLTISGTGIANTNLTRDIVGTTKYFTHIPLATTTLPTGLNMTNSLDVPPINYPITLVDEVIISKAAYNPVTRVMTIKAASRDKLAPLPTLTVPQFAAPNVLDATGTLVTTLPVNSIPPMTVTVNSSKLGTATSFVSVVTPPAPPVAVVDTATTAFNTAVTISVLANDTTTDVLDPTTVVTAAPVGGTAVANANGTVTFTPTTGFSGAASFTYTVKDSFGQASNSVTVSITVSAPLAPLTIATASPVTSYAVGSGAYNDIITATGGTPPYTFFNPVGGTGLPTGISLFPNGQLFGGGATVTGTYTFNVSVLDSANGLVTKQFTLVVTSGPLALTTTSPLPGYTIGSGVYNGIINATGGTAPYSFSITAGALPDGISLFSNGQLFGGGATVAGTYNFTVTVTDSLAATASQAYALVVQ